MYYAILVALDASSTWMPAAIMATFLECILMAVYACTSHPQVGNAILKNILGVIQRLEKAVRPSVAKVSLYRVLWGCLCVAGGLHFGGGTCCNTTLMWQGLAAGYGRCFCYRTACCNEG